MRLMMFGDSNVHKERRQEPYGQSYPVWDDEMDMRRGRRSRSMMDDDMEMRRGRRSRSMMDDDMAMRRGRVMLDDAYHYHPGDFDAMDMRHGRAMGDDGMTARQIGFHPDMHGGAHMGKKAMEYGKAAVEQLDPRLDAVLEDASHVLKAVPDTWEPYLKAGDFAGIARMEGKELLKALDQGKSIKDVRKELTHTLAAIFQMLVK